MKRVILTHVLAAVFFCSYQLSADNFNFTASSLLVLECPPNVTVPCGEDLSDLDQFGVAYVYGYGDPYPAPDPHVAYHLNDCGVGHIIRTWMVKDYYNVWHSCTQVISVQGGGFGPHNITWPKDYETDKCGASLHPNHLPSGFNKPVFDHVECGKPMHSFDDWVFNLGGGCKKILRTWTVIDWCVYDPNSYYPKGIWKHTQVIMIKLEDGPEISCPDDITVSTTNDECDGAFVQLEKAIAVSVCGGPANVMNNSPFAIKGDGDASGYYPLGTITVTFTADDGCSEKSSCTTKVTVKDLKKPTPVCYHGLSSTLSQMSDGYYLDLQAHWFNLKSFDNCTADEDLKFDVSPQRVDCDDLGRIEVILTVTDESGNSDFCITYITITDNFGLCPPEDSLIVGGGVYDHRLNYIDQVTILLKDEQDEVLNTAFVINGQYELINKSDEKVLYVEAISTDDPLNGVTTFDLLLMSKYMLGEWEPENSLDLLAADVNLDGEINSKDLLLVKDVILGNRTNFPMGSSWRFYDSGFEFENAVQPYRDDIPAKIELKDPEEVISNIDFSGVKLGDINFSAFPNELSGEKTTERAILELEIIEDKHSDLNVLQILSPSQSMEVYGFQLGLNIGKGNELLQLSSDIFLYEEISWNILDDGQLRLMVFSSNPYLVAEGSNLLKLVLSDGVVNMDLDGFENEFYPDLKQAMSIKFIPSNQFSLAGKDSDEGISVYPNPFGDEISVSIDEKFSTAGSISFRLADISGRTIHSESINYDFNSGYFRAINTENLQPGLYLIFIETEGKTFVEKVIKK